MNLKSSIVLLTCSEIIMDQRYCILHADCEPLLTGLTRYWGPQEHHDLAKRCNENGTPYEEVLDPVKRNIHVKK